MARVGWRLGRGKALFLSEAFMSWKDLKVSEDLEDFIAPPPYHFKCLRGAKLILNKNTQNIKKIEGMNLRAFKRELFD
jgi:hypothetical protein